MQSIHFEIPTSPITIRKEYLYDLKSGHGEYVQGKLFAISSYPGHTITFKVLVEDKYIYSYLPITALTGKRCEQMSLKESCYFNCPSGELTWTVFESLTRCQVFKRDGSFLDSGRYIMTLDWHNDNELGHLIELDGGNVVMWPSHKIVFSDNKEDKLPDFKKLHAEWKV